MSNVLAQLSDSFILLVKIAKMYRLDTVARMFTRDKFVGNRQTRGIE